MSRRAFTAIVLLTTVFGLGGSLTLHAAPAPPQCTVENGQFFIDQGQYDKAIREFTCVIEAQPTEVEGYRGRIEAYLLLDRYADAVYDQNLVIAFVLPVHPDAWGTILEGYADRLSVAPDNIAALTGVSFAHWWFFQYAQAIQVLDHLLDVEPDSLYGNLFRGSSRLLLGATKAKGIADLEVAISIAQLSADVHFIVADAYTYGLSDPERAFQEAMLALVLGLDTPRVHAILASAYLAFGDDLAAATHIHRHIELVTTELITISPIAAGTTLHLGLVPGRTYEIPLAVTADETLSILTSSHDFTDTILVLLDPDGSPIVGSDDSRVYFAGLKWDAPASGVYRLLVTSFDSVRHGDLIVTRR